MTLCFTRNKVMEVEPLEDGNLSVTWRLVDSFLEANILMKVRVPELEIMEIKAGVPRSLHTECTQAPDSIHKVVGVRIGPGLRKIVRGLIGGEPGCNELADGVLECCNAVILHFTVPQIRAGEKLGDEERLEATRANLKTNPRLVGSCVAFGKDSPIMQGLDL